MGAHAAHARDVAAGLGVARLGHLPEPVDDLELRVAEVLGALAHAPLEHPVVADDELLLLDQQPREHAEHPPHRGRVRPEHRVEVRGADLHRLAVEHRDDRGGPRRAVEHGELAERVARAQLGEHVELGALGAAHLERAADHQVHASRRASPPRTRSHRPRSGAGARSRPARRAPSPGRQSEHLALRRRSASGSNPHERAPVCA